MKRHLRIFMVIMAMVCRWQGGPNKQRLDGGQVKIWVEEGRRLFLIKSEVYPV